MQQGAIDLLSTRLPAVKPESRQEMSLVMAKIIAMLSKILSTHEDSELVASIFKALKVISSTANTAEEAHLVDVIPIILQKLRVRSPVDGSFASLSSIMYA